MNENFGERFASLRKAAGYTPVEFAAEVAEYFHRARDAQAAQERAGSLTMTTVQITLPDQLAQEAQRAGLLSPAKLERWLRDQLKTQRTDELFAAMDRMEAVDEPAVMSPEEVAQEIAAMRAERRDKRAN